MNMAPADTLVCDTAQLPLGSLTRRLLTVVS